MLWWRSSSDNRSRGMDVANMDMTFSEMGNLWLTVV